tara:strand:+ start:14373 stop:14843 length:471 start_codon:yes stop_codon:yes gene_type:complete
LEKNEIIMNKMKLLNLARIFCLYFIFFIAIGCTNTEPAPLIINDAHLNASLKGVKITSGYMSIRNHTKKIIEVTDIDCSPFRAEIHETILNKQGNMKMQEVKSFLISPESRTIFSPGGKHIMLWGLEEFNDKELDCLLILKNENPISFNFLVQDSE